MTNEGLPKTKKQLLDERIEIEERLRFKESQTEANIQAGIIERGAPDQDKDADIAELAIIDEQLTAFAGAEQDARIEDANQAPLRGID